MRKIRTMVSCGGSKEERHNNNSNSNKLTTKTMGPSTRTGAAMEMSMT